MDDFVFALAYWSLNAKGGLRFTLPPIAAVGLPEAAAREQAPKLRVNSAKVPDWYTARRIGESVYGYKTLVEEDSGRILGAHLVGPHADEGVQPIRPRHSP